MYLASATAYGYLACWEADPVTRVYGTTGDYRWVNAPSAQQPKYDPLINPGDDLKNYADPEATPVPTPDPAEQQEIEAPEEVLPPLQLFVKNNPVISGVIGGFMLLIMILNIVLMVRINRIKNAASKRAKKLEKERIK